MVDKSLLLFILIFPLIGSFISYILGKENENYRNIFNVIMTGIEFVVVTILFKYVMKAPIELLIPDIMGTGLHLKLDVFRYIFVWITSIVWFLTTIYSLQYLISYKNRNRYYLFFMLTLGSTIGIFISENLLNLFTFFEIMSLTSYALVIHDEDDYSHEAGDTYITMAVAGGLVLLMGLFLLYNYTQTLEISQLHDKINTIGNMKYIISALIIIGFGVKAGMFPLHVWLPKAHPAAPAPASAILSGILLKTGIFGILITSQIIMKGDIYISTAIFILGLINMFLGGLLAIFQRNIKRILAYSSMSQMGYILVGIGLMGILKEHNAVAIYGTLYHIINHAIFKVLLFMGAGIIYMVLHELSINKIGGFGKNKLLLKIILLIGSLAIIGMPGFNGFISKSILHEALSEAHHMYGGLFFTASEIIFTVSSSFTTAYLLKIFIAVFVEESDHDIGNIKAKITKRALLPMAVLAGIIIYIGLRPNVIMNIIDKALEPFGEVHPLSVSFYTFSQIKSSVITIFIGVIIYLVFVRKVLKKGEGIKWYYVNPALSWFNLERDVYKPVSNVIFIISSFILKIIDTTLVSSATFVANSMDALSKMDINYTKLLKEKIKNNFTDISQSVSEIDKNMPSEEEIKSVKESIRNFGNMLNSVTYSIFIFAFVLVVCLVVLVK